MPFVLPEVTCPIMDWCARGKVVARQEGSCLGLSRLARCFLSLLSLGIETLSASRCGHFFDTGQHMRGKSRFRLPEGGASETVLVGVTHSCMGSCFTLAWRASVEFALGLRDTIYDASETDGSGIEGTACAHPMFAAGLGHGRLRGRWSSASPWPTTLGGVPGTVWRRGTL